MLLLLQKEEVRRKKLASLLVLRRWSSNSETGFFFLQSQQQCYEEHSSQVIKKLDPLHHLTALLPKTQCTIFSIQFYGFICKFFIFRQNKVITLPLSSRAGRFHKSN